jgi:predicted RNase H-like nuclease
MVYLKDCKDILARKIIREIHPEICFWALSGGRPMQYSKKKQEGFFERQRVLGYVYPKTEAIINEALTAYRRSEVAKDDIIDALAAAVTAKLGFGKFSAIPKIPQVDSKGLDMEMVYFAFGEAK